MRNSDQIVRSGEGKWVFLGGVTGIYKYGDSDLLAVLVYFCNLMKEHVYF